MKKIIFIISIILVCYLYYFFNKQYIKSVSFSDDVIYLTNNEEYKLDYDIQYYDEYIVNYKFVSKDDNIIQIYNDKIIAKNYGSTTINFIYNNKIYDSVEVIVSDLYNKANLNNNKDFLSCNQYTSEDNELLDKILEFKINKKGYKTRAGVVEAARFLTLNFNNRISYFYENGRLNNYENREYVDGEGRYYHKGLYLNDTKKEKLKSNLHGPEIWGCNLYSRVIKSISPNGLDCSGFVTWALLNGGFDIGDVGAGDYEQYTNELSDIGEKISIDEIDYKEVKVGDLIGYDGHIAIIIGIDNDFFYIAEALEPDLHVLKIKKDKLDDNFDYIILMDNVYKSEGNLSEMW